ELNVGNRCFNGRCKIGKRYYMYAGRQIRLKLRHELLDALDHADGVGPRLALHVQDDRGGLVHPRRLIVVLYAIHDAGYVGQHHRRTVAERNYNFPIVVGGDQLIVGVDLIILARPIEVPFSGVHTGLGQRTAQVFQVDAVRRQRRGISLNADGGLLAAADGYKPDPVELRDLRRKTRVHKVLDLRKRNGTRGDGQGEHRGIGWIGFAVSRRRGQNGWQKTLRRVDRRLHLFLSYINIQSQVELQHNDGTSAGTGGGHLAQTLQMAELALQWRRHRGRHHRRACSGIKREYLNGRIIDLRQGGDRQLGIANNTHEEDCSHQQRGRNRPQDKRTRWAHGALLPFVAAGAGLVEPGLELWFEVLFAIVTTVFSCNLSKLLVATTSPALMPSTCVSPPSVTPGFMLRICAILFWMTYTNDAWPFC